ncbi:MAG TPA: hypothetical protein ENN03_03025 [bacterium]|nr:hypothetical protein [bacterium]
MNLMQKCLAVLIPAVLLITACQKKNSTEPGLNAPPSIINLKAVPEAVGFGLTSRLWVTVEDDKKDRLSFRWDCEAGAFSNIQSMAKSAVSQTKVFRDSVLWTAPDSLGIFTIAVVVSDGLDSTRAEKDIEVKGFFYDNFSDSLDLWVQSYCDARVEDGIMHMLGNTEGYTASLSHIPDQAIRPEYTLEAVVTYSGIPDSSDFYGIFFNVNDAGYPAVTNYLFAVLPGRPNNWALLAFLYDDLNSDWFLLDSQSTGYSALLDAEEITLVRLGMTMTADKRVRVLANDQLVHESDEIANLETILGRDLSVSARYFGIRGSYDFEVLSDEALLSTVRENTSGRFEILSRTLEGRFGKETRILPPVLVPLRSRLQ